ncbi:MAG: hypothetical protein C0631_02835 [Sedimenticola sp.]|nr:MAG: hypothetical protein C0631_02835 [Sedimenticola sp.]
MKGQTTTQAVSTQLVEKFKQQARKHKRAHAVSHTDALESVAISNEFNHWKHVTLLLNEETKKLEKASRHGLIIAVDHKAEDISFTQSFIQSPDAYFFCKAILKDEHRRGYLRRVNESFADRFLEMQLINTMDALNTLTYYRYDEDKIPDNFHDVLNLVDPQRDFFASLHVWLRGEFHDGTDFDLRGNDIPADLYEI